jgi:two-component system sensor histidine kinase HydH
LFSSCQPRDIALFKHGWMLNWATREFAGVTSSSMPTRPFNLRLWFAVGSFATITLICVFIGFWVSNFLTRNLLERESEVSQEFMESIIDADASAVFRDDGAGPRTPNPLLLEFANHIISMPGMLRVNIHAPSHRILWSTEKQLVGKVFEDNDELDDALRGERVIEIGTLPDAKPEHVGLGDSGRFIEAYVPIRLDRGRGAVVGVVEFYKRPLGLDVAIQNGRRVVWMSAALAAIVLFAALYWIVQKGAQLIERQQQHMARMEAFAAIGQMSSAVAHSLRNPMSAIRSSAELWRSDQPSGRCEIADDVIGEVDRMDGYVRDLLAYARAEPYYLQPVDPLKVVDAIVAKQSQAIDRNRIKVQTVDGRAGSEKVMADEMLLEQALTSVMTNAIEAMPDGGALDVSIAPGSGKGTIRVEIADSGHGIPAELLERVAHSYFTTKARGLGLGLVLAKSIIERFDGVLAISSTRDVGTKVFVELKSA